MLISYNWLQQYVETPWSAEELARRLTAAGVAVDTVTWRAENLSGVVTGRLTEVKPHPNAEKLRICSVDVGKHGLLTIVTGASNVYPGAVVPVAMSGAKLPMGKEIVTADLRGIESQGMLGSGDELGIERKAIPPELRDGIYLLPDDTPIGVELQEVMGLNDYVLELDLTPNRSDCMSMLGVAYEVAALLGESVRLPEMLNLACDATHPEIPLTVLDRELCPGYFGLVIDDVCIAPSPLWMQNVLQAAGIRPINNLVDITNYTLLELGQPLHAFDMDKLQGPAIVVRRAKSGESIMTLDEVERELTEDMLVIADAEHPVALAGIMGGAETEVSGTTRRVLLESAYFHYMNIRRTSRQVGLRTDASSRFDKGVDPGRVLMALRRAAALVKQLGCGKPQLQIVGAMDGISLEQNIRLRPERVNALLGTELPEHTMITLLKRLGLQVDAGTSPWSVVAPSRRSDLQDEIDLVEEVARLHGYHHIPVGRMPGEVRQGGRSVRQQMIYETRKLLLGLGLDEIVTVSFINPQEAEAITSEGHGWRQMLMLQNPLSGDRAAMRPALLFGMLNVLSRNLARQQNNLSLFEMANVFRPRECSGQPEEPLHLSVALTGAPAEGWQDSAQPYDFFYVKGITERLIQQHRRHTISWSRANNAVLHPGRSADIVVDGNNLGFVGELHPDVLEYYGIKQRVVVAEINLEPLLADQPEVPLYQGMPKYPGVERDVALIIDAAIPAEKVATEIKAAGGDLLVGIKLFDIYTGGQVGANKRSLAYRLLFQSRERTLTEADVNEVYNEIVSSLQVRLGASLR